MISLLWTAFDLNTDCNRKCSFCCNKASPSGRFTKEDIYAMIRKIEAIISKYEVKNISVPILGGEPLLYPDLPIDLTISLKKLPAKVDVWMYTNGDFLADSILAEYKKHKIWITLSAAESPIEELIDKILILKRFYRVPRLSVTLTENNLKRLMNIVRKSIEIGFTIRFRNQYDCSRESFLPDLYKEIVPEALRLYAENPVLTPRNLVYTYEDIWPYWNDVRSPYTCGRSFLHFCANGDIRACSGDPNSVHLGNIYDDDDPIEKLRKTVNAGQAGRWSAKNIKECQGCEVYNLCQGGCPLSRKLAYERFDKPSPYCGGFRKAIPIFINLAQKLEKCDRG